MQRPSPLSHWDSIHPPHNRTRDPPRFLPPPIRRRKNQQRRSEAVLTHSSLRKTHGISASSDNQTTSSSTHSEKEFSIHVLIIKDLINAENVENISLTDNATTATAIVLPQIGRCLSSGEFSETNYVMMFHCAYQVVKKSIDSYVTPVGGDFIEVQLPFPVHSDQEIIAEFKKGLKRGKVNGGRVREKEVDPIFRRRCSRHWKLAREC